MKQLILTIFLSLLLFSGFAQDVPERPNPPRLVNDLANVMTPEQQQQMEAELDEFANQTSTQIAVVTLPSLNGFDISDLAIRIGEKWGVGQKGKNNGIVILFKPKTGNEKGQVFIAVGYGLESIIPDAVANRNVVDYEMIPRFKEGDIYGGLEAGIKVIKSLAIGEYTAKAYQKKTDKKSDSGGGFILVILIIIVLISIFRGGRGRHYNSGGSLPFWIAMGLMSGSRGGGSWGNFSGGGGGGFGGGGGGFGGFGGGSFGGGGAGGSW